MIKNPRTLISWGAALATATAVAVTVGATTGGPPESASHLPSGGRPTAQPAKPRAQETRQIASSVLGKDFKFTLTALRSRTDPFAASVRLQVFTFRGGTWKKSDQTTIGAVDSWFWFPLTGPHAVCKFSTASIVPAPVTVSLLITPSIGCSPDRNFEIKDGRIVTA